MRSLPTNIKLNPFCLFVNSCLQLLFGCLHMGSLSVFLSDQFVSGFTAGVSVHIGSSQLHGLGFNVSKHTGAFPLIRVIIHYSTFFRIKKNPFIP